MMGPGFLEDSVIRQLNLQKLLNFLSPAAPHANSTAARPGQRMVNSSPAKRMVH